MDIRIEKATATRLPTEEEFGQIGERGKKKKESGKGKRKRRQCDATQRVLLQGLRCTQLMLQKVTKLVALETAEGVGKCAGSCERGSALSSAAVVSLGNRYQPQCRASPVGAQRTV